MRLLHSHREPRLLLFLLHHCLHMASIPKLLHGYKVPSTCHSSQDERGKDQGSKRRPTRFKELSQKLSQQLPLIFLWPLLVARKSGRCRF